MVTILSGKHPVLLKGDLQVRLWNWDAKQETHIATLGQKDTKITGAWFINELHPGTVFYTEASRLNGT
jgi:hypothetical protein